LLICLYFFCGIFSAFHYFVIFFFGINPWISQVDATTCLAILAIPGPLLFGLFPLMTAIALDRMLCILFPIW
jgi:hypothetical protein